MGHLEDKRIKDAILRGTDEAAELKNMIWNNIQKELSLDEGKVRSLKRSDRRKKSGLKGFIKYGSIAAAVAVIIGTNTQYGQAAVSKIKELFAPNKVVKQEIEGMPSEDNMALKESSMKYIIYIDEEMYTMENLEGKDKIVPKNKAANYPEVFMEIQQVKDKKPEVVASEVEKELKVKFKTVKNEGTVKDPINSILLRANSGTNSKDTVVQYYLVDNTKGGTFVIKQQYFMEAAEGHGARFYHMLKEFKVVSE
jgi:hypothetical protein